MATEATAGAQGDTDSAAAETTAQTSTAVVTGETAATTDAGASTSTSAGDTAAGEGKGEAAAGAAAATGKTDDKAGGNAGATDDAAGAAAAKPPDKYAFVVADDGKPYVDDQILARVEAMARQAGWSQDDAQAQLNDYITQMQGLSATFLAQTKGDPEYGGEHLAHSQRLANAVINRIRPDGHPRRDSFLGFLQRFGGNNHLEVVAFLADLGKLMAEDSPGSTAAGGGAAKTTEQLLYPSQT